MTELVLIVLGIALSFGLGWRLAWTRGRINMLVQRRAAGR